MYYRQNLTTSSADLDDVNDDLSDTNNQIETANNRIETMKRRIEALKKAAEQLRVNATSIRELDVGGKKQGAVFVARDVASYTFVQNNRLPVHHGLIILK